jgi:hypothetical protein
MHRLLRGGEKKRLAVSGLPHLRVQDSSGKRKRRAKLQRALSASVLHFVYINSGRILLPPANPGLPFSDGRRLRARHRWHDHHLLRSNGHRSAHGSSERNGIRRHSRAANYSGHDSRHIRRSCRGIRRKKVRARSAGAYPAEDARMMPSRARNRRSIRANSTCPSRCGSNIRRCRRVQRLRSTRRAPLRYWRAE